MLTGREITYTANLKALIRQVLIDQGSLSRLEIIERLKSVNDDVDWYAERYAVQRALSRMLDIGELTLRYKHTYSRLSLYELRIDENNPSQV